MEIDKTLIYYYDFIVITSTPTVQRYFNLKTVWSELVYNVSIDYNHSVYTF